MSNLLRKYKIHKLIPCLTVAEIGIFTYIKDIFGDTIPYKPSNIDHITYYMDKEGKCIYRAVMDINDNSIYEISIMREIWHTLINYSYEINRSDVQDILRWYIKNDECSIKILSGSTRHNVEELYSK